jgi:zinc transport system substrate-binding protein
MLLVASVLGWSASAARAQDLKVVTTIKPVHSIVATVMAGVGEPSLLVDGIASPHTFALKPSDARLVNGATHFFRVSEGLEPFTGKLVKALPKTVKVVTLADAPGLKLYRLRTSDGFEVHKHEGHGHGHAHGKAETDGHIWLDPDNAKLMAAHVAEVLAQAAPKHAEALRKNAERFATETDALSREIGARLAPLAGRPYLVFHDAYQYFERRFGLTPAGSVTVSPEVPPSAKRLTDLRRKIQSLKAVCVFAEPQFAPKVIDTITEGTGARKGVLDPLGAAIAAGPGHYARLIGALANDLNSCLANPA